MKKTVFITSLFLVALTIPARAQSVFPDVPDNHWAAAAAKKLAAAGIIEGRPASVKRAASTRAATAERKTVVATARRKTGAATPKVAARKTVATRAAKRTGKTENRRLKTFRKAPLRKQG